MAPGVLGSPRYCDLRSPNEDCEAERAIARFDAVFCNKRRLESWRFAVLPRTARRTSYLVV